MGRDRDVQADAPRDRIDGPHIFQRGRVWWAYVGGGERISLKTRDSAEAQKRFAERLAERAALGPRVTRSKELTLVALAREYFAAPLGWTKQTTRTQTLRCLAFVQAMQDRGVLYPSQITELALDHWRKSRMTRSRATITRDEVVARSFLAWGADRKLCGPTPLAELKLLRVPKRGPAPLIPSPKTVRRVIAAMQGLAAEALAAPTRKGAGALKRTRTHESMSGAALAVETALLTGMRLDELRHIEASHLVGGAVRIVPEQGAADDAWTTKSFKERRVPLAPEAQAVVRAFAAWRLQGQQGRISALTQGWLADKIRAGAKRAGVEAFDPHDLRRTFATECVRGGVPITVVRDWLGHRDVSTTERYLGRYPEDETLVAPRI